MNIEMEVSLYPLAEEYLEHRVKDFAELLEKHECEVKHTEMSSIVSGISDNSSRI